MNRAHLLHKNMITNLNISRFLQQNVRNIFDFWCITQYIIIISKMFRIKYHLSLLPKLFKMLTFYEWTTLSTRKMFTEKQKKKRKNIIAKTTYTLLRSESKSSVDYACNYVHNVPVVDILIPEFLSEIIRDLPVCVYRTAYSDAL